MRLALIVAMTPERVIGYQNQLPWHVSADLKHFKALTLGKPVIMGRKTYESIGKPLPERRNIIISRNPDFNAPGCEVCTSLQQALSLVEAQEEVMIIGGATLFEQALPLAERIYLTILQLQVPGDTFLPTWPANEWQEIDSQAFIDEKSQTKGHFITLQRV
jgi:dihydrofolate reductase